MQLVRVLSLTCLISTSWYVSNDQMKLWGAVMLESEKAFLKLYPDGKFLVVIGPNSKLAARSIEELRNRGVGFLDLSQLLDKENKHYKSIGLRLIQTRGTT